jgi:nitronate monooxygenase
MGADGVVVGTRFLFSPECQYTDAMKNVLVNSTWESTERSNAYDQAFQTDFWPSHIDGRAISTNDLMKDYKAGLPLEERIKRYQEATAAGKDTHLVMWAGVGVAQTDKIQPAAVSALVTCAFGVILQFPQEIFDELHNEAVQTLQQASLLLK